MFSYHYYFCIILHLSVINKVYLISGVYFKISTELLVTVDRDILSLKSFVCILLLSMLAAYTHCVLIFAHTKDYSCTSLCILLVPHSTPRKFVV